MKRKCLWWGIAIVLLLWPVVPAFAEGPLPGSGDGQFFVDENVTLQPGETFSGHLGILNGNLDMPQGSTVIGDVFITGGDATIAGRVSGNLAVIGGHLDLAEAGSVSGDVFATGGTHEVAGHVDGNLSVFFGSLTLRSTALVGGDLLVTPGAVDRAAGAQVLGNEVQSLTNPKLPFLRQQPEGAPGVMPVPTPQVPRVVPPSTLQLPASPGESFGQRLGHFLGRSLVGMFLGLLFIAVGVLIAVILPRATRQVTDCIAVLPIQSFGLGLLTFLIAAGLEAVAGVVVILIILLGALLVGTVILIPIGILLMLLSWLVLLPVPLALVGGMVLGWVAMAQLIGQKVLHALRIHSTAPVGAVLVGMVITVAIAVVLWIVRPLCCAWPFVILLTSMGLGAVFHTRFGTRRCGPGRAKATSEALPPEAMDQETGQPDTTAGVTS